MNLFPTAAKTSWSLYAYLLIIICYLFSFFAYKVWKDGILSGADEWGYYAYLPATFIHKDLSTLDKSYHARFLYFKNRHVYLDATDELGEAPKAKNGKRVIRYTMGVALLQAPFFFAAHILAKAGLASPDGYAPIYIISIHIGLLIWVLIGFWWLRQALSHYFTESITAIVLVALGLGTNIYYFALHSMSHGYLFTLYAALLLATIRWYRQQNFKNAFLIGLSIGFILLIRPVEIIAFLIPLLYGIDSFAALQRRPALLLKQWKQYSFALFAAIPPGLLQAVYWKYTTGHWLYYSYPGESFNFVQPHIFDGLFSYNNGWLVYTPLMFFALVGFLLLTKKTLRGWLLPFSIFLFLHIYITYSWWCWQYIRGFGSRPMVEIYPIMAFALGALLFGVFKIKFKIANVLLLFIWLLLIANNLVQTYQVQKGMLFSEVTNRSYFWQILGKTHLDINDLIVFDSNEKQPSKTNLRQIESIATESFEDSSFAAFQVEDTVYNGQFSLRLGRVYSPGIEIPASKTKKGWLRADIAAYSLRRWVNPYSMGRLVMSLEMPDGKKLKWTCMIIENKLCVAELSNITLFGGARGRWCNLGFFTKIPDNIPDSAIWKIYVENINNEFPLWIDDLKLSVWE